MHQRRGLWQFSATHTGGTASAASEAVVALGPACTGPVWWRDVAEALAPTATLSAVVLPGRLTRMREPALVDLVAVVDDVCRSVREVLDETSAGLHLVGVCAGASVMASVAKSLTMLGAPVHLHLINPPDRRRARTMPRLHDLAGPDFRSELVRQHLIPHELVDHPNVLRQLEPMLRADLSVGWQAANSGVEVSDEIVGVSAMASQEFLGGVDAWAPPAGFRILQALDADRSAVLARPEKSFGSHLRTAVIENRSTRGN